MNKKNWVLLMGRARKRYKGLHPRAWFSGNEGAWRIHIINKETKQIIAQTPKRKTQDEAIQMMLDFFMENNKNTYKGKN